MCPHQWQRVYPSSLFAVDWALSSDGGTLPPGGGNFSCLWCIRNELPNESAFVHLPIKLHFVVSFSLHSLQRCSTMPGGETPVTTSSLYLLQSSSSLVWSYSPSGTDSFLMFICVLSSYFTLKPFLCCLQDYLLYVGLPSDHLQTFLWLLLLQWTFDDSTVSTRLLGCPHHTHSSPFPHQQCEQINTQNSIIYVYILAAL